MDVNADFKVSRPGKDEGLHETGAEVLFKGCFSIPVLDKERLFDNFFRDELFPALVEIGWNFAYSRSRSYKIQLNINKQIFNRL